jgi:hypothetical protein
MDKFENYKRAKAAYLEALDEFGEDDVVALFRVFFENNPGIYGVLWTQWTPSYNDGEPCEFMVTEQCAFTKDALLDVISEERYKEEILESLEAGDDQEVFSSLNISVLESMPSVGDLKKTPFPEIDEEILKSVFGDGFRVVVTRNCVYTTEYYD